MFITYPYARPEDDPSNLVDRVSLADRHAFRPLRRYAFRIFCSNRYFGYVEFVVPLPHGAGDRSNDREISISRLIYRYDIRSYLENRTLSTRSRRKLILISNTRNFSILENVMVFRTESVIDYRNTDKKLIYRIYVYTCSNYACDRKYTKRPRDSAPVLFSLFRVIVSTEIWSVCGRRRAWHLALSSPPPPPPPPSSVVVTI